MVIRVAKLACAIRSSDLRAAGAHLEHGREPGAEGRPRHLDPAVSRRISCFRTGFPKFVLEIFCRLAEQRKLDAQWEEAVWQNYIHVAI